MPAEQQQKCIQEYKSSYVLKVCGYNQFLLENAPMIQYKVSYDPLQGQLMIQYKISNAALFLIC